MNLQDEIAALEEQLSGMISPEMNDSIENVISGLKDADLAHKGPQVGASVTNFSLPNIYKGRKVGDKVPDFKLLSHLGEEVSLSELLAKGPVVINFYRGGWCPYCNLELKALQRILPDIEANGGQLVAISLDKPDLSIETAALNSLNYLVLSDIDAKVATQFGILFDVPDSYQVILSGFEVSLEERNATNKAELVIPATYVIDAESVIRFAFIDEDFRKRVDTDDIIDTLKEIKG